MQVDGFLRNDRMDEYLESQGLWRKHIPRDGSCLFRAVSEQLFHTQAYHLKFREKCIDFLRENENLFSPFVESEYSLYLEKLSSPNEWAGHVEMGALSLIYKRDFVVYQEVGVPPIKVTANGFTDWITLCYSHGSHYDSVYQKSDLADAAFCQSLVYGILYKKVFNLGDDVDLAVERMLHDKTYTKQKRNTLFQQREMRRSGKISPAFIIDKDDKKDESGEGEIRKVLSQGLPPFPYKVAKVLDPNIYRNVEYDLWNEIRKEQVRSEQLVIPEIIPGVKCVVKMADYKYEMHAHVQEMHPNRGPVTVFVEELGAMRIVPYDSLQPIPIPIYKALAMETSGKNRAFHAYLRSLAFPFERLKGRKKLSRKSMKDFPVIFPLVQNTSVIHLTHSPVVTTSTPIRHSYQKLRQHIPVTSKENENQTNENHSKSLVNTQSNHTAVPCEIPRYWNAFQPMFGTPQNQISPISSSMSSTGTELEVPNNSTLFSIDVSHRQEQKTLDFSRESGFYSSNKTLEITQFQNSPLSTPETCFLPSTPYPASQGCQQTSYTYGSTCPYCPYFIYVPPNAEQENSTVQGDGYALYNYNVPPFTDEIQQQSSLVSMPEQAVWSYNGNFAYVLGGPQPYGMYNCSNANSMVRQPYLMLCNTPTSQVPTMP